MRFFSSTDCHLIDDPYDCTRRAIYSLDNNGRHHNAVKMREAPIEIHILYDQESTIFSLEQYSMGRQSLFQVLH